MTVDVDTLLNIARERLKFTGVVIIKKVAQSEVESPQFGFQGALTCSSPDASKHLVRYVEVDVNDASFYHEFCHIKINEIGFKKAELKIGQGATQELKRGLIFIAEAYANEVFFRYFKQESAFEREALDYSFTLITPLRTVIENLGYTAIAMGAGFSIAKIASGFNGERAIQATFEELGHGNIFNRIFSVMSKLPKITDKKGVIVNLTDDEISSIVECTLELSLEEIEWNKKNTKQASEVPKKLYRDNSPEN